jgi:pimeloyl-ACP methyl ester carboxylesterase
MIATLPQNTGTYELFYHLTGQRYTLSIPESYPGSPAALILVLHYGGPVTPYYGRSILEGLAAPALAELGALMVAPDCLRGSWDNPESENDLLALLSLLEENYRLAPGKTLVTGYSMGAQGAWRLAARHSERFAVGIAMAGPAPLEHMDIPWRTPMYVIHSQQDEHFPYERTASAVDQLIANGAPITFQTIRGVTHFNAAGFFEPLRSTVPWIRKIWQESNKEIEMQIDKNETYTLYKNTTDVLLGNISGAQLQFLVDNLEEEFLEDRDYAITNLTVDYLGARGADPELTTLLLQALGDSEEITIIWKRAS